MPKKPFVIATTLPEFIKHGVNMANEYMDKAEQEGSFAKKMMAFGMLHMLRRMNLSGQWSIVKTALDRYDNLEIHSGYSGGYDDYDDEWVEDWGDK